MPVSFFLTDSEYKLRNKNRIRRWIHLTIKEYNRNPGTINIILCSDSYLLEINTKYLKHNYFTDIITFNFNEGDIISGELYISIERVIENSKKFRTKEEIELIRVIIHGILHLLGYKDDTKTQKDLMRKLENKAIAGFKTIV